MIQHGDDAAEVAAQLAVHKVPYAAGHSWRPGRVVLGAVGAPCRLRVIQARGGIGHRPVTAPSRRHPFLQPEGTENYQHEELIDIYTET